MDVKSSFLYGNLDETIYMKKPKGFGLGDKEDYVCKLNRYLYGLMNSLLELVFSVTSMILASSSSL